MTNKCTMTNKNLWSGDFKDKEMNLYDGLKERDIEIIKEYQKKLPVFQDDSVEKIDARDLHKQLKVGKDFIPWIKGRISKYDFIIEEDYIMNYKTPSKPVIAYDSKFGNVVLTQEEMELMTPQKRSYYGISEEYILSLDMAKELCMIENNEIGRTSRKYFIAVEKAFKSRKTWNKNRMGSINEYYNLREVVFKDLYNENRLGDFVVGWWNIYENKTQRKNTYAYELYLLDQVVIGMSAQDYRKLHNLRKGIAIRNTFNEEQLKDFEMLQSKSAEYLVVNKMYNTEERFKTLKKFYEYYKENK